MILSPINSITPKLVEFALDGLSLRHQAIASNIANVNSEGYKPVSVSFENQLNVLKNSFYGGSMNETNFNFTPIVSYGKKQDKSVGSVGIDMNTVKLNQNVIQYQALIKGIDHYISTLSVAIKEGRN
jgi:flagellar basal-body rod protein FlgB